MEWLRYLHVVAIITAIGLVVANYYYVTTAFKSESLNYIKFILKKSLIIDVFVLLFLFVITIVTGALLIYLLHLLIMPWIVAVYRFFILAFVLWMMTVFIKIYNFRHHNNNPKISFRAKRAFHFTNILFFVCIFWVLRISIFKG